MKKKIRLISIFLAVVFLAGECMPVYAAKSPGGNTDFPGNPFDIVIPTDPKAPGRKKKNSASAGGSTVKVPAAPAATGPGGPVQPAMQPGEDETMNDFVAKTTVYANGIIEASTIKPYDGLKYKLVITPYAQYPTIADMLSREMCPVAFSEVTATPVLSDYLPIVRQKAAEAGVSPESCYPYQLFDVTYYRDYGDHLEKSDLFDSITLSLPNYVLDHFVCLLHYKDGVWSVVENADVIREKGWLRFGVDSLSPFTIVVSDGSTDGSTAVIRSPQTGYDFLTESCLAIKEWLADHFQTHE